MAVTLTDSDTGATIGTITEEQLAQLVEHLEEETPEDQDYWIDGATLDALEEEGVDAAVIGLLRAAVGDRDGLEVRWTKG
ncbi:MAG: galactosyldiacylglycerol synthase [bacterium]|nr:galactosyldiacylglycerol synthase [bacterium]